MGCANQGQRRNGRLAASASKSELSHRGPNGTWLFDSPSRWTADRAATAPPADAASRSIPSRERQRARGGRAADGPTAGVVFANLDAERHAGHAPDLSKTGDMFERMVAFVGRSIRVDR